MLKPDLNFGSITVHSLGLQYCLLSPQQLCQEIGIRSLFSITRFVFFYFLTLCVRALYHGLLQLVILCC